MMEAVQKALNDAGGRKVANKPLYDYMVKALDDRNEAVLYRTMKALELAGAVEDATIDKMAAIVGRGSAPLKRAGAKALATIGDSRAVTPLAVQLAKEPDAGVALVVSAALHKLTGRPDLVAGARNEVEFEMAKLRWLAVAVKGPPGVALSKAEANGILVRQLSVNQPLEVWAGIIKELCDLNGMSGGAWGPPDPGDAAEVKTSRQAWLKHFNVTPAD
jgi:hypothetical protein